MPDTHTTSVDQQRLEKERIEDDGTVTLTRGGHAIHCLTVIGQVEGHTEAPQGQKTTKYEHVIPQLAAVQAGRLEDWELEGARSTMRSALASLPDSQGALENYCLGQAATGQSEDPETMQRLLDQVTPERIQAAAQSVTLDTVYFLHGKEDA